VVVGSVAVVGSVLIIARVTNIGSCLSVIVSHHCDRDVESRVATTSRAQERWYLSYDVKANDDKHNTRGLEAHYGEANRLVVDERVCVS
jgi:hypothetical protein